MKLTSLTKPCFALKPCLTLKQGIIALLFSVLIMATILPGSSAGAKEGPDNRLTVGFINVDWFPFQYQKDGRFIGFAIDVVAAIMKQMRRDVAFQPKSFSAALAKLENGELDIYFGLGKTLKRTKKYYYTKDPLFVDETVLIGQAGDPFKFNGDVSGLISKKVGIIKGAVHGPAFDNMNGILRIPHDSGKLNTDQFFNDLLTDKMNFIVVNARRGAHYYLKALNLQNRLKIYEEPVAIKNYYLVFSNKFPKSVKTAKRFERMHRLFRSTSEYDRLLKKYGLSRKLFPK